MRVFLDACCLFAAGASPGGGSAKIILSSRDLDFTLILTMETISEAKKKLIKKIDEDAFMRLVSMFRGSSRELIPNPSPKEMEAFEKITVEKDLHVLAGAVKGRADVLVTLDRKHLLTAKVRESSPVPVMDTKAFWKAVREGKL